MTPSTKTPTCAAVEPRTLTTVYCPLPFTSRTCTPGTIFSKSGRSFCSPLYSSGRMTVTVPGESLDSQSGRFASTVIPASSNSGASEADNASAAPTPPKNCLRCCTASPPRPYLRCVNSVSYSSYVPLFPEETVLSPHHRLSDRYKKAAEKQAVLCTHFMAQKHALYLRLFIR